MNRVNIYRTTLKEQTTISNIFIDEYMANANDAQLKIYLFLIRMMNANLPTSVTDIADKFNYTEKDVLRALMYWESLQLLSLDFDAAHNLSGIQVLSLESPIEVQKTTAPRITPVLSFVRPASKMGCTSSNSAMVSTDTIVSADNILSTDNIESTDAIESTNTMAYNKAVQNNSKYLSNTDMLDCSINKTIQKPEYSLDELKNFKSNEDIEQLLMVTEQYVGKQLTRSDMETILFFYDKLGFSVDLIDYLVQHCVERGKKDFRYMEKVALAWHEQGIISPKDAQEVTRRYDKVVYTIMKSLGKNTNPAPKELEYINKWTKEYGFLLDVIQEACDKTVMTTDNHRFAYADGILSKWYKAGVHHKSDISKVDAAYNHSVRNASKSRRNDSSVIKNKFNNFVQNTYDFDELEQNILSN